MEARRVVAVDRQSNELLNWLNPEPELSGMTEIACGSDEFDPLFPFPPRASRGGRVSPHAGSTPPASKKRWHAAMLPAPPSRGLPPPCGSPASAVAQNLDRSEQTACLAEGGRKSADVGESFTQKS
jgi:hypothetical protein